jgi:sulfatase modifying factor 1
MKSNLEKIKNWLGLKASKQEPAAEISTRNTFRPKDETTGSHAQKPEIEWASIPAGRFTMGSPENEPERLDNESAHQVSLSAFRMSKQVITLGQFKAFIDSTGYVTDSDKGVVISGSFLWTGKEYIHKSGVNWTCDEQGNPRPIEEYNYPVVHVSWNDAVAFAEWMGCRLPTEADWEYACRAGTSTPFHTGNNLTTSQANYNGNFPYNNHEKGVYRATIMPVASFPPNAWGLYDMHGNVFEWCSDWYGRYSAEAQANPNGPAKGLLRVRRGGSWGYFARDCRSAFRNSREPDFRTGGAGFRIVSDET